MAEQRFVLPEITVRPPEEEPTPAPLGAGGGADVAPTIEIAPPTFRDRAGQAIPLGNPPPAAEPPSLPSDDPWLTRTYRSAKDFITGESRIPDAEADTPEWWNSDLFTGWQKAGLSAVASSTMNPQAVADAAMARLPEGAKLVTDAQGNLIVTSGGKRAYIDRPGMSATNAMQIAGFAPNLTVAGRIARIGAIGGQAILNTGIRSITQGAGQAATELAKQGLSVAGGSKQGIEAEPIVSAGVGGALAEPAVAIAQGAGRMAARAIGRRAAPPLLNQAGAQLPAGAPVQWNQINETGRRLLNQAGIDATTLPADVTAETMQRWSTMMPSMNTAAAALADTPEAREMARRTFQSARFNVPFTLGQMTGDTAQLGREDFLRQSGAFPNAKTTMQRFSGFTPGEGPPSAQQAATAAAAQRVAGTAGQGEAEFGNQFRTALQQTAAQMEAGTTAAYGRMSAATGREMRDLPFSQQTILTPQTSQRILTDVSAMTDLPYISDRAREAARTVANLIAHPGGDNQALAHAALTRGAGWQRPRLRSFNVGDYNEARRYLGRLRGADRTDNMVISRLTRALDRAVDDAAAQVPGGNLMVGPPQAVQHLRDARAAARREFAAFEPENPEVAHFIETILRPGVSGQDVATALMGAAEVGSKSGTSQILDHVRAIYPIGSGAQANAARQAVRDGLVHHMVYSGDAAPAAMQPGNVANRIDRGLNGRGREIMEGVLTPAELDQLRGYAGLLRTMQETGKQNLSGTAYVMANWLRNQGSAVGWIARSVGDAAKARADAARATAGRLPDKLPRDVETPLSELRGSIAPAAGGAAGSDRDIRPAAAGVMTGALHPGDTARKVGTGLLNFYDWGTGKK